MYLNFSHTNLSETEEISGKQIKSIYFLNNKPINFLKKEKEKTQVGEFKTINFFVGANNSGKSRFLKALLKSCDEFIEISSQEGKSLESMKKDIDIFCEKVVKGEGFFEIIDSYNSIFKNLDDYKMLKNNIDSNEKELFFKNLKENSVLANFNNTFGFNHFRKSVNNLFEEIFFIQRNEPKNKIYIPILRSTHNSPHLNTDSFEKTIELNYKIKEDIIFTGLEVYDKVYRFNNAKDHKRVDLEEFQSFLSKYFFNNKKVKLTYDIEDKELLIQVGKDEKAIHHVGDGIQAIIILLLPVFTAQDKTWLFIEEPETHLHPGFQRIFLETILNDEYIKSKNLKFFFTTHSNHFLDLTIDKNDISIFQFQKINSERFEIKENVKPDKEILDKLGVQSSSIFLANTSIWVEGPTDRKYISKFLKLYVNSKRNESPLKEDIDFAFFEYGGNLITHYLFDDEIEYSEEEVKDIINSFALSNRICLIADNDNAKGKSQKARRAEELEILSKKSSNFLYLNTICKEIENLLPLKTVNGFMETLIKKEVEKISFKRDDYKNIGLGKFYKDKFIESGFKEKYLKAFYSNSGTLKNDYKLKICNYFLESDITYKELIYNNEELRVFIEKLYDFIKKK
ncbi:AAA family ATPase [Kordia zhangzhouensis]|uniref:AAA family ATPase n=1 Tax=Kordia zhangzhouensis TaxID=1620405 RepID=UPI000B0E85AC|nr:ATP-binding protein [Kordia zhangzhouensis]